MSGDTIELKLNNDEKIDNTVREVYEALQEKGYDPLAQFCGYLISGDPTYITSHKRARSKIVTVDVYGLLERVVKVYLEENFDNKEERKGDTKNE